MHLTRPCLFALATLASVLAPAVASAQSTPIDQPFAVATEVSMPIAKTKLTATLTPAMFGCTGSQVFYMRSLVVGAVLAAGENSGGYYITLDVAQNRPGAPTATAPLTFLGAGGNGGILFGQTYMLSSVGAPVTAITISKAGWAATFSAVAWGYCANPTSLAAVTWK
jgi:hypothetical protein